MKVFMVGSVKTFDEEREYVIFSSFQKLVRPERNLPAAEVNSTASGANMQAAKYPGSVSRWMKLIDGL